MKIPFSAYDFFAYLASGLVLLCSADFAFKLGWFLGQDLKVSDGVFIILVAYVVGHLVAHFSSLLYEHGIVRGLIGSPEVHLIDSSQNNGWRKLLFRGFVRPFPKETVSRVLQKSRNFGFESAGRGLFFHCHSRVKSCKSTSDRLSAFLNQYGFCRNLSFALLLASLVLAVGSKWGFASASLFAALGMFFRYLKFFRHYTQEVYRTYSELNDLREGQV